jgi:membrane protein DedA with SNARE-associated domain
MLELLVHYKYIALAISMIVGGDIVLISATYLMFQHYFSFWPLLFTCLGSTLLADYLWYLLGKHMPESSLVHAKLRRKNIVDRINTFFTTHRYKTLFYSKFIYGTRTVVQILSGTHRVPLLAYFSLNFVGTLGYMLLIFALGFTFDKSLDLFKESVHRLQFGILFILVFGAIIAFFIKKWNNVQQ